MSKPTEYSIHCSRYLRNFTVTNNVTINIGEMVAIDTTTGLAVVPTDAANRVVVGIAQNKATGGDTIFVLSGCFGITNDTTNAVDAASINKKIYIKNATTVDDNGGTNKVVAGICRFIDPQNQKVAVEIGNYFN